MDASHPNGISVDDVAAALYTSADDIWNRAHARLLEIPSYQRVAVEEIRASHSLNVERAAQTIRSGRLPPSGDIAEAQTTTTARLRVGVPIEDIIRGYRLSIGATFEQFVAIARRMHLDDDELMKGSTLLWGLSDLFVTQAVLVHQRLAVDAVIGETRRRDDHVRAALSGSASRAELEQWLPRQAGPFRAVVARVDRDGRELVDAKLRFEKSLLEAGIPGVLGGIDGAVAGYVVDLIPPPVPGLRIAVGHRVEFGDLTASFSIARRVHRAARPDTTVATLETSGWRLTVDTLEPLAKHFRSRYLEPLQELGEFGEELLATLHAFLAADRHVDRCAVSMNLHPNSLRYRLRKLSEALDVDLNRTDTIVELCMSLELLRRSSIPISSM